MTEKKRKIKKGAGATFEALFCSLSTLALLLTFFNSDAALESMSRGMRLCVGSVIPSLFPFLVLSDIFVASGATDIVARVLGGAISRIFGVRRECAPAVILGILFGFPIGTRCALSLYDKGLIERRELEHLLVFCNGPSSAFLIGAVGVSLFGSKKFGILLCFAELFSALVIAILSRRYFLPKRICNGRSPCKSAPKELPKRAKKGVVEVITDAVSGAAQGMITICAFVIFFSAFVGVLEVYISKWGVSNEIKAVIFGFFELSGGVSKASMISGYAAYLFCAAFVGWSGLSVHFQFISLCSKYEISYKPYFAAKFLRAILDCAAVAAAIALFSDALGLADLSPYHLPTPSVPSSLVFFSLPKPIIAATLAAFLCGAITAYRRATRRR